MKMVKFSLLWATFTWIIVHAINLNCGTGLLIAVMVLVIPAKTLTCLEYQAFQTLVKYFQFEVAESEYKSKKTGELKTTKRTERVQRKASIADLVD